MEELDEHDMQLIATAQFTHMPPPLLRRMIGFTRALQREVVVLRRFGARGAPWDFNLRDLFRWCALMQAEQVAPHWRPWDFVDVLFVQRMRTAEDRQAVLRLYAEWLAAPEASVSPHAPQPSPTAEEPTEASSCAMSETAIPCATCVFGKRERVEARASGLETLRDLC